MSLPQGRLPDAARTALRELGPAARRASDLDPRSLVRLRIADGSASALLRLPFGVLVARTIDVEQQLATTDTTVRAVELVRWLDGDDDQPPEPLDELWRWAVPPTTGLQRVETVPDTQLRPIVRQGALTLKEAAAREGLPPGTQPRAEVADVLLDSVVLTAQSADGLRAEVTLRALSALVRMGFLARDSVAHLDVNG